MREEYDLKRMKVKRRGVMPLLMAEDPGQQVKVRITISLDQDVVEYFKQAAQQPGALPYQTQINQTLRKTMSKTTENGEMLDVSSIKKELLADADFIRKLAKKVETPKNSKRV